jgi:aminoglycoside adenylyltransferase-like protein
MPPSAYPHVNSLLERLLLRMWQILGSKLVGLYVTGSLVVGDFDPDISDVDLLAAITDDLTGAEFAALKQMHDDIVLHDPQWDNRIEIAYLSLKALKTFKTDSSKIGIISPGEPFHIIDAGKDWLVNWYIVWEKGVTLFGPPPQTLIAPISKEEFLDTVRNHVRGWREWMDHVHSRPYQGYAILTMCRALYTLTNGEQVSKIQAAAWVSKQMPEWAGLIGEALRWRKAVREPVANPEATLPETRRFVNYVIDCILGDEKS